jgi:acetolactate synthase-1/2/3 large subunit
MTAIYAVNFVDRQIMTILASPIKQAFDLSNLQLGLLTGFAFALFYSVLGVPTARLADTGDRVKLLAMACLLWSLMTAACGAAGNFVQLFIARMLVGVGEAACVPASHSLICDFTKAEDRPRALALFALGIPIGTLLGLIIGGVVAQTLGWRLSFAAAAIPGAILALIALKTLKDPVRPGRVVARLSARPPRRFAPLAANPEFRNLCLGASASSMGGYGIVSFLGVYLAERIDLSIAQIGLGLGLVIGVGGGIGVYAGGAIAAWLARRGASPLLSGVLGLCAAGVAIFAALGAGTPAAAFAGLFVVAAGNALWYGPVFAAVQSLAAKDNRATAAATLNLVVNLLGLGLGPASVGFIADTVGGAQGLTVALSSLAFFNAWGAVHLLLAGRAARRDSVAPDLATTRALEGDPPTMPTKTQTGADAFIGSLADHGVEVCFANPGTSELDLVLALDREPRIRPVAVTFEGVASGAADGYARITGRPAATLLHLAPGYLNAAANFHNARRAFSPIVSIIGDHALAHRRFDTPLTADLEAIVRPQSVWTRTVSKAEDAAAAGAEAVREAIARRGQASVIYCADAAWTSVPAERRKHAPATASFSVSPAIDAAAAAIRRSQKPALLIGGDALSEAGLRAAARLSAYGIRVLSEGFPARQARGQGRFTPEKIAYFAEMSIAQLADADLLVLAGARAPVSFFAYPGRPVRGAPAGGALIDLDAQAGLAADCLAQLADRLGAPPRGSIDSAPLDAALIDGPLTAPMLARALAGRIPEGAIVSDDGVTASHFAFAASANAAPHDWMCLTGGALGQGAPVAIGAAIAAPDRKVVCLTGDGAFLYTPQSLWTIARENLDIVIIVAVNRSYEILKIELARMGEVNAGRASRTLLSLDDPAIDYRRLAQSFGVEARRADTVIAFDRLLAEAMTHRGPLLIEALISP